MPKLAARPPLPIVDTPKTSPSVIIVGAGYGGLATAIALKRAGVTDITILERANEVGGAWYANKYPGLAVDTSIYSYSLSYYPLPESGWTEFFASGSELLGYLIEVSNRFDVRRHIHFKTTVTEMHWESSDHRWVVTTAGGKTFEADIAISAAGVLSTPSIPKLAGLEKFRGTILHSTDVPDPFDATGLRVAQVGSGASAIQIMPNIAKSARQVFVYQRSAPWIFPRDDREIGKWERVVNQRLPWILKARRWKRFVENDYVAYGFEKQGSTVQVQTAMAVDFIERSIKDPELRRAVTPDYEIGCKRRVMSNDWYPALQRENVQLVPHALVEAKETSVVGGDGIEREVDTIIFSTGFAVKDFMPMKVFGMGGRELHDSWADGAKTHLGMSTAGYPNLFFVSGPNAGIGSGSAVFMLECQTRYIAGAISHMRTRNLRSLELLEVVQARTYREIQQRLAGSVYGSGCMGWYQNRNGTNDTLWPGLTAEYWWRTRRFNQHNYVATKAD